MARISVKADFSDVGEAFEKLYQEVVETEREVGEAACEKAKQEGNYKNHTFTLRKSNKHKEDKDGLTLYNDATSPQGHQYASDVEAKGYIVLSSQALWAEAEMQRRTKG